MMLASLQIYVGQGMSMAESTEMVLRRALASAATVGNSIVFLRFANAATQLESVQRVAAYRFGAAFPCGRAGMASCLHLCLHVCLRAHWVFSVWA